GRLAEDGGAVATKADQCRRVEALRLGVNADTLPGPHDPEAVGLIAVAVDGRKARSAGAAGDGRPTVRRAKDRRDTVVGVIDSRPGVAGLAGDTAVRARPAEHPGPGVGEAGHAGEAGGGCGGGRAAADAHAEDADRVGGGAGLAADPDALVVA